MNKYQKRFKEFIDRKKNGVPYKQEDIDDYYSIMTDLGKIYDDETSKSEYRKAVNKIAEAKLYFCDDTYQNISETFLKEEIYKLHHLVDMYEDGECSRIRNLISKYKRELETENHKLLNEQNAVEQKRLEDSIKLLNDLLEVGNE